MRTPTTGFRHFVCPVCGSTTAGLFDLDEDERAERLERHYAAMHERAA